MADEILYRHDEPHLELGEAGRPWSFDGDGALFCLVSEAHPIRLAHLLDPVLAVHTSRDLTARLPKRLTQLSAHYVEVRGGPSDRPRSGEHPI